MKRLLPVLMLLAGLGCSVSFAQEVQQLSPFDRYLRGIRTGQPDPALVRVASQCSVNLKTATARYAQRPGETWKIVKNLFRAQEDQETDFYATATVWHSGHNVLVEDWNMDLEAGDEIRTLYCLFDRQVKSGEQIEWSSAQEGDDSSASAGWGYEVRWRVEQGKFFKSTLERFVNERDKPVSKPKLGPDAPIVFGVIPEMKDWSDLKLPDAMLQ